MRKQSSVVIENILKTQLKIKAKKDQESRELLKLFFSFENLKNLGIFLSLCKRLFSSIYRERKGLKHIKIELI